MDITFLKFHIFSEFSLHFSGPYYENLPNFMCYSSVQCVSCLISVPKESTLQHSKCAFVSETINRNAPSLNSSSPSVYVTSLHRDQILPSTEMNFTARGWNTDNKRKQKSFTINEKSKYISTSCCTYWYICWTGIMPETFSVHTKYYCEEPLRAWKKLCRVWTFLQVA
jgi:hypothetical protein